MTNENAKDYLPFVQALVEGKKILVQTGPERWEMIENPKFNRPPKYYKIAKEPRRFWVNVYNDGSRNFSTSKEKADYYKNEDCIEIIETIEVIK
jgi:hypothetical protein